MSLPQVEILREITITGIGTGIDALSVSNVQANSFSAGQLNYFDTSGVLQSVSGVKLAIINKYWWVILGAIY
jgi:hypothetical protein